jgi:hypothetical protein
MGLAIVRAVMEAHGGSVALHDARGGGCEFVLRLPTSRRTPAVPPAVPPTAAATAPAADERPAEVRVFGGYQPSTNGHSAGHDVDLTLT